MRGPSWVTALALVSMAGAAAAQTWPDKPVRIVVPLTAGSSTDLMARSLANLGAEQKLMEPRAFDGEIRKEIAVNAALVKAAGIPISSP